MRSRTAWASPTSRRPWSRAAARICSAAASASARARSPGGDHLVALGFGRPAHVVGQDLALDPTALDLVLGLAAQGVGLGQDLGPPGAGLPLGLRRSRARASAWASRTMRAADSSALDRMPADASRAASSTRAGLLAQQLDQAVLVELLGEVRPVLGPLGPLVLVGLLPLDAADHLRQLVEEGTDLGGVVPLADGGELPAGDARRIERGLGRHGSAWYDPNTARAEGRFSDLSSVAERARKCWGFGASHIAATRQHRHRRRADRRPACDARISPSAAAADSPTVGQIVDVAAVVAEGVERLVDRVDRHDLEVVAGVGHGVLVVVARDEEQVEAVLPHRGRLLPGAADRPDRAVGLDRAGDGHVGAAGQVAGGEVVDEGQRERQAGRRARRRRPCRS